MNVVRVLPRARAAIQDIDAYTVAKWGEAQADNYVHGLFEHFDKIASQQTPWRPLPPEFKGKGHLSRYRNHIIVFRELPGDAIGIAAIFHARMDLGNRLTSVFDPPQV